MTQQITSQTSVADRLAEKLRASDFGELMDEDALTAIARDAIDRAFFQPRRKGDGFHRSELPPLVVELAQKSFEAAIGERAKVLVDEIVKSDAFIEAITTAAILAIPGAIQGMSYSIVTSGLEQARGHSVDVLKQSLAERLREMRTTGIL